MLTGGAGARAMARAFEDVMGIRGGLGRLSMAGRTDAWILAQTASAHGVEFDPARLFEFRAAYLSHLAREVLLPGPRKGLMPGVAALLETLAQRADVYLALLTGNFEEGARVKLEHFDLWRYFKCGAFGDTTADRNALLGLALARVEACGGPSRLDPSNVVVIGDTPHDVEVARSGGVRSLAVATGTFDAAALQASGADEVLEDFADLETTLQALGL